MKKFELVIVGGGLTAARAIKSYRESPAEHQLRAAGFGSVEVAVHDFPAAAAGRIEITELIRRTDLAGRARPVVDAWVPWYRPPARQRVLGRRLRELNQSQAVVCHVNDAVDLHAADDAEVVVVVPALVGRLRYWTSDDRQARQAADERLACCLDSLQASGLNARGLIGEADPLQAIEDALRLFAADEIIIIAAHDEGRSNWLAEDIIVRARKRLSPPVHPVAAKAERQLAIASAA